MVEASRRRTIQGGDRATRGCDTQTVKVWPVVPRTFQVVCSAALSVLLAVACTPTSAVPNGAQVVHIVSTEQAVTLTPDTVRAGDVYLMLDEPIPGSISFFQAQETAEGTPGPLDDAGLERLRHGDTIHTAQTGFEAGGCNAAQDSENRGRMGPCGNVLKFVLSPGTYAVVRGSPEGGNGTQARIAVLTVIP